MRLSVLIAAVAVLFPAMDMQAQTASGKKVLVAYFSHSGNTREMARQIAEATNGDLFEIVPQSAYPAQYDAVTAQAKREIGRGYRPALKGRLPDIGAYDVVFVGSPCWWGTVAPPVATFLASYDFAGKTIVPFATSGGSGFGNTVKELQPSAPNTEIVEGKILNSKSEIEKFAKSL